MRRTCYDEIVALIEKSEILMLRTTLVSASDLNGMSDSLRTSYTYILLKLGLNSTTRCS